MVDIMVLGGLFVVEVMKGVELVVGCVVRLVMWCANGRGYFLCCFGLKSVEMNGLSVGGYLFGMVIWPNCFLLLECHVLGKMVGTDLVMEVVLQVFVVEAVDVMQAGFFCLFQAWLFGGYDGCESGDRGCGWCGGVGLVEMVFVVRMGIAIGDVGTRGEGVVSSGGAKCEDCCRFPDGISGELWEDLPYHLPFTLNIDDVFL